MKHRFRRGQLVEITFLDHTVGDETLEFSVWGRVLSVTSLSITIAYWDYASPAKDRNRIGRDENTSKHTIVRSAITGATELVPKAV